MILFCTLYFDSSISWSNARPEMNPLIKKVWQVDLSKRENAWLFIIGAIESGVSEFAVRELMSKWSINQSEAHHFTNATGIKVKFIKGLPRVIQ